MRAVDERRSMRLRRRSTWRNAAAPYDAVLTAEGRRLLEAKAAELRATLPSLRQAVTDDPDEELTRTVLETSLDELRRLESVLAQAAPVVAQGHAGAQVSLGDRISVAFLPHPPDGDTTGEDALIEEFLLVHPFEAPLDLVRISVTSPLGRAVLGRQVGEVVEFDSPSGRRAVRILTRTPGC
jgi:transcription elongation GreA/GreB family factor